MTDSQSLSESQKQYLAGLVMGADVARAISGLPILSRATPTQGQTLHLGNGPTKINGQTIATAPEKPAIEAQDTVLASGKKLVKEEQAKREKNGLDIWDEIEKRAVNNEFPKGTDVFLTKFHGLFYVAPAQDSYMCRMRLPGGVLHAWQLRGLASLCEKAAGGFVDITTRANLQLREIPADKAMDILYGLRELDIITLGSGADNIRNCTASALSGLDDQELIETIPLAKKMHHAILNHRECYGLPRKFNIAFDGSGKISSLDDTNDIGFHAVEVSEANASDDLKSGIYFQLTVGGITGHRDFARYTNVLLKPNECIAVAIAIVQVFIDTGDRTDRNRARLKYVLDRLGFDSFIELVEQKLARSLRKVDSMRLTIHSNENRTAHIGFHPQKQAGKNYVGLVLPVGRITSEQAMVIADISETYGNGETRLTVWQNLIIPNIDDNAIEQVKQTLTRLGIGYEASSFRAGLVACTGNAGCKFAASNTKSHAMQIARFLETRFVMDTPLNIHLTGCHHSCAQHYIGDIGLLGCKVEQGDDMIEGYHVHIGGGWGNRQATARLVFEAIPFHDVPPLLAELVDFYLRHRRNGEDFASFAARKTDAELKELVVVRL